MALTGENGGELACSVLSWATPQAVTRDASAKKTGRVLIVHEAIRTGGFGGEIAARVADEAFPYLDAPVRRVTALDSFCPFAPSLESEVLPSAADVEDALRELAAF